MSVLAFDTSHLGAARRPLYVQGALRETIIAGEPNTQAPSRNRESLYFLCVPAYDRVLLRTTIIHLRALLSDPVEIKYAREVIFMLE